MSDDNKNAQQRIPSLPKDQWGEKVHELMEMVGEPGASFNFTHWFVNHIDLATKYLQFGRALLDGKLSGRLREIIVLRIAWRYESEYEWMQHVQIGKLFDIGEDHLEAVKQGPDAEIWTNLERNCLRATDQLCMQNDIDDETWSALASELDSQQLIELLFVIGNYVMLAWVLRAVRMPLEDIFAV